QANLSFMTPHASVREAIEAAAPRLREMLGGTGIGMGSVSVNVGSFAQQQQAPSQQQEQGRASWHSAVADATFSGETLTTFVQPLRGRGMVDFFA
ncbi:MAG TPA: flagellar hook-length control protein FliK, partial [Novimethylophilus sp.]|uniref:flagellar hook-length control protein FliK n=1 Tax=Novimethylophilus sp. TaxID=2137426 RepID=UPI002F41A0A4